MLLLSCAAPEKPETHWVRGGLLTAGTFEPRPWSPGVDGAPLVAECVPLFHVELEDRDRLAAMGAPAPAAAMAFSPDGAWLAIGSDAGSLRVVDGWTGAPRAERRIAEGAVKQVAWSADGATLYVGEQSPDALVQALDPATLATRWSVRLADDLETSVLPPEDDVYGLYSLPGAYAVRVLDDGTLLVAGAHGWTPADGVRRNLSRLYHLASDGSRLGVWPRDTSADAILLHPAVHGRRALVGVSRSAAGPAPEGLPIGGVAAVDVDRMEVAWTRTWSPLAPHFSSVFLWEGVGLGDDLAFAGLGDGRAFLFDGAGAELAVLTPGVPVMSQGVPISAGVGFGAVVGDAAYFLTTVTNIPWGSADPMTRPPSAHPAQHTVHAVRRDGTVLWSRPFEHAVQGIVASPDGGELLVGAAERAFDTRADLYGALILDRATGDVRATCATEGPAHFRPVFAPDGGRVAVAESAFLAGEEVRGAYRVTVFR
ncbi:MAG: hypothetical protein ACOZNI_24060 [Myxococcota bacterium]